MKFIVNSRKPDLNGLEFEFEVEAIDYIESLGYYALMFPDRGLIWDCMADSENDAGENAVGEILIHD
jgi:hypothetical protein